MLLICPNCHAKSKLKKELLPTKGAWAKCPKCSERFFVHPQGQAASLNIENKGSVTTQTKPNYKKRTEESQKLIKKLDVQSGKKETNIAKTSLKPNFEEELFSIVTVFPKATVSPLTCGFLLVIFAVAVFLFIASAFLSTASFRQERNANLIFENPQKYVVPTYSEKDIAQDIENLRKNLQNTSEPTTYMVEQVGLESRLAKGFLERLNPNGCQEITDLKVSTYPNYSGFQMEATCYDTNFYNPLLSFQLNPENNKAMLVSLKADNFTNSEEIDLWAHVSENFKKEIEKNRNILKEELEKQNKTSLEAE